MAKEISSGHHRQIPRRSISGGTSHARSLLESVQIETRVVRTARPLRWFQAQVTENRWEQFLQVNVRTLQTMKTQTIFSDPATALSIASAIYRRSSVMKRPGIVELLTSWVRHRLR
jgi:hypothetical protein